MSTHLKSLFVNIICIVVVIVVFCIPLTGCGQKHKLSGRYTYAAGNQTIEFAPTAHTFVWTANGNTYQGAYRWEESRGCYYLEFYEEGNIFALMYTAKVDGNKLIVNGGEFENVPFVRE